MRISSLRRIGALAGAASLAFALAPAALAHPDPDGGHVDDGMHRHDPAENLELQDMESSGIVSAGPTGKKIKNMELAGRGERLVGNATTDVWAHENFAYIGTFNVPCGTGFDGGGPVSLVDDVSAPGIAIFDVHNKNKPAYVGNLPSVEGSRTNDVKVADMNSGDVLVYSNESCGGGPGGFEIFNVDDPANPVHQASVRINELNPISNALFGGLTDVGVHNLFLFSQEDSDYVGVVSEGAFDNFRIYDITDPTNPTLASGWGAEETFDPGVGDETTDVGRVLTAALWLLDGPGSSQNRFLHDVTVNEAGDRAYLSNWDAGLVLLDISNPSNPTLISQAIDLENGSLDGELNSHAAWPSADGSIVVETEEDFDAWEALAPPSNLTLDSDFPGDPTIPAAAISTTAGDDFEANQTGNVGSTDGSSVVVNSGPLAGNQYPAVELDTAAGSPTFADTGPVSGELVYIGRGCATSEGDAILNAGAFDAGDIAVVRRGACFFEEKAAAAASLNASAVIIANNNPNSTPWGGVRIWDYSDPANPVLASTFDTVCSAAPTPIEGVCDPAGTYSVHNVVVEDKGNKVLAYISWYWDGMVVLDVTDPYNPQEIARYVDNSPEFLASNGGLPHDFWGVYKIPNEPTIYGSDRNGGLYTFKLTGKGKIGKN